jgi:hypothetical protein
MSIVTETWWGREIVPAELSAVFRTLCSHFHSDPAGGGTKGNTAHTTGRHRSIEFCLNSAYCTDRSYGTRDKRDRDGNHRHIRALDVALNPTQMRQVSHRLDDAVRGGDAPMVAEWFGTFNNRTVVGWFEGHASSADSSHLYHVHVGVWTKYADDKAALNNLYAIMTGEDMPITSADAKLIAAELAKNKEFLAAVAQATWDRDQIPAPRPPYNDDDYETNPTWQADNTLRALMEQLRKNAAAGTMLAEKVDQILSSIENGVVVPALVDLTTESIATTAVASARATIDELRAHPLVPNL